eukprot:gene16791-18486_t
MKSNPFPNIYYDPIAGKLHWKQTDGEISHQDDREISYNDDSDYDPYYVRSTQQFSSITHETFLGSKLVRGTIEYLTNNMFDEFMKEITETVRENDFYHVALPGGSSIKPMLAKLCKAKHKIDAKYLHVWIVDERCVPLNHTLSNFKLIHDNLLNCLQLPYFNIHPIRVDAACQYRNLQAYEEDIKSWIPSMKFNMIILGLGADGHVASLFPWDHAALNSTEAIIVTDKGPKNNVPRRVSMSFHLINSARKVIVIAAGEKKKNIIEKLKTAGYTSNEEVPVLLLRRDFKSVTWKFDEKLPRIEVDQKCKKIDDGDCRMKLHFFLSNSCLLSILFVSSCLSFERLENETEDSCICKDKSLCAALKVGPRQEVYGFSTESSNWKHYDWEKITTISVFGKWDPEMLCYAHSKGVRLTLKFDCPVSKLVDEGYRKEQINAVLEKAKSLYADGINIDIEQPVKQGSPEEKAMTEFSKEITEAFHAQIPGSQVTVDVAWSPKCIDSRCYDYASLANVTDFLIVMSYDERSQIFGDCIAGPNSAYQITSQGITKYLALGIDSKKLVLGLPWYGYNYPCIRFSGRNRCEIKKVPFRGVNCSDAAGRQYCYSSILSEFLPKAIGGRQFDDESQSPFFNYRDAEDDSMHQIWYDDPQSLILKYQHGIRDFNLRGLAFWNINCLNYTDSAKAKAETKKMWDAVFVN